MAILLLATSSSAVAAGRTARCPDVTASGGVFVAQQVRATAISCRSLRGKLQSWTRRGSASLPHGARGWRCTRLAGTASSWKCNRRGHAARATFAITRDRKAPTIALASPVQGAQYELGASVTASYVCSDNVAVAKCAGTVPSGSALPTSQAGTNTFTVTATDKSGNDATRTVTYTVVNRQSSAPDTRQPPAPDTTAPTISMRSPVEGAKYTFGSSVQADYSCADNGALESCNGTVANGSAIPTDVLGTKTFSVTAKDAAGNVAAKQVTYTVTDAKPPTITVTAPVAGASFSWNQSVNAGYSCADEAALATCAATVAGKGVADNAALPTSGSPGPGTRTLEVVATDTSGNVTTTRVNYTVKPAGYYALTYDDGPNGDFTQPVLNALASVNANATFFVVGSQVQVFPELARAIVAGGNWLQNHTMTHANLGPLDPADPSVPPTSPNPSAEMSGASAAIAAVPGAVAPTFIRPPYGSYNQATMDLARSLGLEVTLWTTETNDYTGITPAQITAAALKVPLGGIILMHDSNQNTVAATPMIVNQLRDERGMLPGKLAKSTTQHFIDGWPDAGGGLGFYAEAVAP